MKKFWLPLVLVGLPFAAQANLIVNGNFESGNTGFTTSYTYVQGTGDALYGAPPVSPANGPGQGMYDEGRYTITNAQPGAWHGSWRNDIDLTGHGYYMLFNGSTAAGGSSVWSQTIAPPLVDGTTYKLSFDLVTVYGLDANPANINISIGTQLVGFVVAPSGTDGWSNVFLEFTYDQSWGSVANILNIETAASGNDFGIDNIVLTATNPVPEPFTMMLGAMGIGAYIRKRRSAKA